VLEISNFHFSFPFSISILVVSIRSVENDACVIWKLTDIICNLFISSLKECFIASFETED